ncbi:MAG: VWA domain-containing protein [Kiritimatiellae bacterium]|nr:VWA domain-containing protein [Kiritimatiellia bacterium]
MKSGGGATVDLLIAALVVSAAVHVGVMMWAEPKVMTHVTSGVARAVRRAPMTAKREEPPDDPVKLEIVEDLPAQKEAPEVDDTAVAAPAPEALLPIPEEALPVSTAIEAPDVLDRLRPDADAPVIPVAPVVDAVKEIDAVASMPVDFYAPAPSLDIGGLAVAGPVPVSAATPEIAPPPEDAPAIDAPVEDEIEKMTSKNDSKDGAEPEFKPSEDVMPEVDEKVVEREKEAVRDLLDVESAADMATAVNVEVGCFRSPDGFTYFKASVTPKGRMMTVPKDVVILIDASGSIGDDRLKSCRKAARAILRSCTNTGDRFNLVAFRDRFSYAFNSWQECNADSFEQGDKWLSRLVAHGRTDVFATIASVLTLPRDPARPLIALVVTDGDANAGVSGTAEILSRFSALNDGLVSVYMYGVKSSANRELIDVLTRGNRGESFVYDGWRWNAGSGIEALSERFRDPVVTDLRVIFPASLEAEAYPSLLKNVYRGNSVEIVGRVKGSPDEISFSLRGLAGTVPYEGFFRLPLSGAAQDEGLPALWSKERAIDLKLH